MQPWELEPAVAVPLLEQPSGLTGKIWRIVQRYLGTPGLSPPPPPDKVDGQ